MGTGEKPPLGSNASASPRKLKRWSILFMMHVLLFAKEKHLLATLLYFSLKKKCFRARESEKFWQGYSATPFLKIHFSTESRDSKEGCIVAGRAPGYQALMGTVGVKNESFLFWVVIDCALHTPCQGTLASAQWGRNDRVCDLDWR